MREDKEIRAVLEPLTKAEEKFCQTYVATSSWGLAYRAAWGGEGKTDRQVWSHGQSVYRLARVQERIKELRLEILEPLNFTVESAIRRFLAIADADPNELVSVEIGCCRYCHGQDHAYQWREREYRQALEAAETNPDGKLPDLSGGFGFNAMEPPHPSCPECDGEGVRHVNIADTTKLSPAGKLLYGGAEQTRNGIKVHVADRQRALEAACRLAGFDVRNVNLQGVVAGMVATVDIEQLNNPEAAEALYREMIKGALTASS